MCLSNQGLKGGVSIIGKLIDWILLGLSNFIPTYNPFNNSGEIFKSLNLIAEVYGVSPEVT